MNTKDTLIKAGNKIKDEVKDKFDDVVLSDDVENVKQKLWETSAAISETASHAKEKAGNFINSSLDDASKKVSTLQDAVKSYVKENPGKSVCYAALAGIITALCLRK